MKLNSHAANSTHVSKGLLVGVGARGPFSELQGKHSQHGVRSNLRKAECSLIRNQIACVVSWFAQESANISYPELQAGPREDHANQDVRCTIQPTGQNGVAQRGPRQYSCNRSHTFASLCGPSFALLSGPAAGRSSKLRHKISHRFGAAVPQLLLRHLSSDRIHGGRCPPLLSHNESESG